MSRVVTMVNLCCLSPVHRQRLSQAGLHNRDGPLFGQPEVVDPEPAGHLPNRALGYRMETSRVVNLGTVLVNSVASSLQTTPQNRLCGTAFGRRRLSRMTETCSTARLSRLDDRLHRSEVPATLHMHIQVGLLLAGHICHWVLQLPRDRQTVIEPLASHRTEG